MHRDDLLLPPRRIEEPIPVTQGGQLFVKETKRNRAQTIKHNQKKDIKKDILRKESSSVLI